MGATSPRSDAVWSEQGTTPDAIEAALRQLLIEVHAGDDNYVPARVLNMIAFVDREWSGEIANRLRGVGRYHASRLVVLAYEPKRERLDARVMIASEGEPAGELALLHETVVVELGDRHLDDLRHDRRPARRHRPAHAVVVPPWSPRDLAELLALAQAVLARLGRGADRARGARARLHSWPSRPTSSTWPGCAARPGASAWPRAFDPPPAAPGAADDQQRDRAPPPGLDRSRRCC